MGSGIHLQFLEHVLIRIEAGIAKTFSLRFSSSQFTPGPTSLRFVLERAEIAVLHRLLTRFAGHSRNRPSRAGGTKGTPLEGSRAWLYA